MLALAAITAVLGVADVQLDAPDLAVGPTSDPLGLCTFEPVNFEVPLQLPAECNGLDGFNDPRCSMRLPGIPGNSTTPAVRDAERVSVHGIDLSSTLIWQPTCTAWLANDNLRQGFGRGLLRPPRA